jgi:endonuclease YncB( thermonuclease family)
MIRLFLSVLLLASSSLLFSQQLTPDVIQGKVVGITDGDTLTILMDSKQYKIRLAEIDTPERNQPYGSKAKDVLSDLVFNKEVKAEVQDVDRYGRYVARIYVGELDVSREMVRLGAAWVYRQYLRDKSLLEVEAGAKVAKRGLWSLPEAQKIPPWEWRRGARQSNIEMPEGCEAKRYCREMTSCQEAQHYLNQCGISSLDGDRDGLACEALCR